mgnify:CR=1 FL=1
MNQLQKFVALYCPNIAIITLAIILWRNFLMKWKISIFPFLLQKIIRQLQIFLEPMVIIQVPLNVQWLLTQTTLSKSLHPLTVQLILRKQKMKMKLYLRFLKIITTFGSCFVSIFETCGCIHNVEINEAFRGNGYSKLLLQYSLYDIKNICQNITSRYKRKRSGI